MKTFWLTIPLTVTVGFVSWAAAGRAATPGEPARLAFISPNRIIAETQEAQADLARFKALQQQKTTDLRTRQRELAVTRQKLAQTTEAATRSELTEQEERQREALEQATSQAQAELQKQQQQMHANLQTRLRPILEDLARRQGIEMVLNADTAVVWASQNHDLTPVVIQRLDGTTAPKTP
jgi:Skp family chaperone for outer membrane proteins